MTLASKCFKATLGVEVRSHTVLRSASKQRWALKWAALEVTLGFEVLQSITGRRSSKSHWASKCFEATLGVKAAIEVRLGVELGFEVGCPRRGFKTKENRWKCKASLGVEV